MHHIHMVLAKQFPARNTVYTPYTHGSGQQIPCQTCRLYTIYIWFWPTNSLPEIPFIHHIHIWFWPTLHITHIARLLHSCNATHAAQTRYQSWPLALHKYKLTLVTADLTVTADLIRLTPPHCTQSSPIL